MRSSRTLAAIVAASTALAFSPAVAVAETTDNTSNTEQSLQGSSTDRPSEPTYWNMIWAIAGQLQIALSGPGPAYASQQMSSGSSGDLFMNSAESSAQGSLDLITGEADAGTIAGLVLGSAAIAALIGGGIWWAQNNNR